MARKIYREGKLGGFYKGLTINLVRTIPNSAVTLLTYVFKLGSNAVLSANLLRLLSTWHNSRYELVVRIMNARTAEEEAAAAEVSSH